MMNKFPIILLIALVAHFVRNTKYKDEYRKNYIGVASTIIILIIANLVTNVVDSQTYINLVLGLYVIAIPILVYFERPMRRKFKEEKNKEIVDRGSEYKLAMLLLLPFIIGLFINTLMASGLTRDNQFFITISGILLSIWIYGGAFIFWFWVGRKFASLGMSKVKSFILGNIGWAISIILFIWQFYLIDQNAMNLIIAGLSQHYALAFTWLGASILGLFTNHINGNTVILLSYVLMILVFSLGFFFKGPAIKEGFSDDK